MNLLKKRRHRIGGVALAFNLAEFSFALENDASCSPFLVVVVVVQFVLVTSRSRSTIALDMDSVSVASRWRSKSTAGNEHLLGVQVGQFLLETFRQPNNAR